MACCSQSACARRSTLPATAFQRPSCSHSRSARHSCADRAVRSSVHQRNKCRSFCHLSWQAAVRTLTYGHARHHVARLTHSVMAYIAAAKSVSHSFVQAGRWQLSTAVAAAADTSADAGKACDRCGASYPLFYFPRKASQPDGHWVHCFGCRYALKLIAKPYRQCATYKLFCHERPLDTDAC